MKGVNFRVYKKLHQPLAPPLRRLQPFHFCYWLNSMVLRWVRKELGFYRMDNRDVSAQFYFISCTVKVGEIWGNFSRKTIFNEFICRSSTASIFLANKMSNSPFDVGILVGFHIRVSWTGAAWGLREPQKLVVAVDGFEGHQVADWIDIAEILMDCGVGSCQKGKLNEKFD